MTTTPARDRSSHPPFLDTILLSAETSGDQQRPLVLIRLGLSNLIAHGMSEFKDRPESVNKFRFVNMRVAGSTLFVGVRVMLVVVAGFWLFAKTFAAVCQPPSFLVLTRSVSRNLSSDSNSRIRGSEKGPGTLSISLM